MSLDLESPVDRSVSKMRHPEKLLALSLALLGLSFQSCDRAATRPVEEPVATEEQPAATPLARAAPVPVPVPAATSSVLPSVDRFNSQRSNGTLADGFKADSHVRWLWGGCTTFLVINDKTKDILLIDAYVDKSTLGNKHYYPVGLLGRERVVRYVNQIRGLVADDYKISGVLMTHGHGDHAGDLPYILSGLKLPSNRPFMQTRMLLTGKAYPQEIKVYMNAEARLVAPHPSTEYMVAFGLYDIALDPMIDATKLAPNGFIYNKPFKTGASFTYGSFSITPHIWYHGTTDGTIALIPFVRTIAYTVEGTGYDNPAKVFMTGSYVEKEDQLNDLNVDIPAHHLLFADGGKMETAFSTRRINLLPNPPSGANYIIPTHNDNNSNIYDMDDNNTDALELYGRILKTGSIAFDKTLHTYWRGSQRNIRLGYFANRLGD